MLQSRKNYIIYDPIDVLKGNASIKLVVTPTQEKIKYWKLFSVKCGKDNSYSTWYHNSDDMTIFQNYAEPKRLIKRQLSSHKTLFACSRDYVGKKFVLFNINVEPWWLFNLKKLFYIRILQKCLSILQLSSYRHEVWWFNINIWLEGLSTYHQWIFMNFFHWSI